MTMQRAFGSPNGFPNQQRSATYLRAFSSRRESKVACFYLPQIGIAVERSRIPDLWGLPVALIDSTGSLVCVSPECAAYGVASGRQLSGARTLCPDLRPLPYDRPTYLAAAEQIWDVLALESSTVEPVSPELSFILVDSSHANPDGCVRDLASKLAAAMRISVYASIANTKFAAEYAAANLAERSTNLNSSIDTDSWIVSTPTGREAALLASCPISRIPRLDSQTRDRLAKLGITRLGDLARAKIPVHRLSRPLREAGRLLSRLAQGIDDDHVRALWPPPSIEHGIDFETVGDGSGVGVTLEAPLHAALQRLSAKSADALVARNEYCRAMRLRISFASGASTETEEKLISPANLAEPITRAAIRLLGRIAPDQPVVSLRLACCELTTGASSQLALLDPRGDSCGLYPHERKLSLDTAAIYIRKRWGPGALLPGSLLNHARKIKLWTYPLGTLLKEEIEVESSGESPIRYRRRAGRRSHGNSYTVQITHIHDRWKEKEWFWGSSYEHSVYRVDSDRDGLVELRHTGRHWSLTACAD